MSGVLIKHIREGIWDLKEAAQVYDALMDKIDYIKKVTRLERHQAHQEETAQLQQEWFQRADALSKSTDQELEDVEDTLCKTFDHTVAWIPVVPEYLEFVHDPTDIACDHEDCWYSMNPDRIGSYRGSYQSRFGTRTYCDVCLDNSDYGITDYAYKYAELFCDWQQSQKRRKTNVPRQDQGGEAM